MSTQRARLRAALPEGTRRLLRRLLSDVRALTHETASQIFARYPSCESAEATGSLLLNIGCGDLFRSNWINLDYSPKRGVHYLNAINGLPFPSGVARHIHCEHFLEHLDFSDARGFLTECYRVLVKGGTIRLILPDAEKYLLAYVKRDSEFFMALRDLGHARDPLRTRMQVINQMFRMGGDHKFAWDFETLSTVLMEVGFTEVRRSAHGEIEPHLNIDGTDWWRSWESLYVNATK